MLWQYQYNKVPESLEDLERILFSNRDVSDPSAFVNPPHPRDLSIKSVGFDLSQVKKAIQRLKEAKDKNQNIVIFGDYDADGICATAVLWQTLYDLGFKVMPFIPHREEHGYGLSNRALDNILLDTKKKKPNLIITVDNGIVAYKPAERLKKEDIDLIITDHHTPEKNLPLPNAVAVVHTTQLCGTSVAWMFAREVMRSYKKTISTDWQLDLCGLATIADQVPLTGANRSFAKHGLEALRGTKRVGLVAIFRQAGLDQQKITSSTVGFGLAPRINAMGRMSHGLDALRLLCTENNQSAQRLADLLGKTNDERRTITTDFYRDAFAQAKSQEKESLIVIHSTDYHEGVIGLIAGRLTERLAKPSIVMSVGEEIVKASARSLTDINIVELIREVRDDLIEVGGHPMAAGFGLETAKLELVKDKLWSLAREKIDLSKLEPRLSIDTVLPFDFIDLELIKVLDKLRPFGQSNPEPVFALSGVTILEIITMGQEQRHLKLVVTDKALAEGESGYKTLQCLFWNKGQFADQLETGQVIDIVGVIEINEWRGRRSVQMRVTDLRQASEA